MVNLQINWHYCSTAAQLDDTNLSIFEDVEDLSNIPDNAVVQNIT